MKLSQADPALASEEPRLAAPEAPAPLPAFERGMPLLAGASAESVLALQRQAGNAAVGRALQRKGDETTAETQPGPAPAVQPAPGAPNPAASNKTKTLTIDAIYHAIPGESTTGAARAATDDEALWFSPLKTHSDAPKIKESTITAAILTTGQQNVETMAAPVTDTPVPVGRGTITPSLRYAKSKNGSYEVKVAGLKGTAAKEATAAMQAFVKQKIEVLGDIDDIQKQAEAKLQEQHPGATVTIEMRKDRSKDYGSATIGYKIKSDAQILLDVVPQQTGEKQVTSAGSATKGKSTEDSSSSKSGSEASQSDKSGSSRDTEQKGEQHEETVEQHYNEAVAKTIDDFVTKSTDRHGHVAEDLAKKVVGDTSTSEKGHQESKGKTERVIDYTKDIEKGKRSKENWAEKLKKVVGIAKKATSLPIGGKLGKVLRRLTEWGIAFDIAEEGLGLFAESGTADYETTKVDSKDTTTQNGSADQTKDTTSHSEEETKATLVRDYTEKTKEDWQRHMTEATSIAKDFRSTTKGSSSSSSTTTHDDHSTQRDDKETRENAEAHKAAENQTTTTSFSVAYKVNYTMPALKATVVGGTAEVKDGSFGPDPDETPAPATANPAPAPAPSP
jgi:hypothetical protein